MEGIKGILDEIEANLASARAEDHKVSTKGNKQAAIRLRGLLINIQKLTHDGRAEVQKQKTAK